MSKSNKVRIYGCGGAGINRAMAIVGIEHGIDCAEFNAVALDTSSSNFDRNNLTLPTYQLKTGVTADGSEAEGSGGVRKSNYPAIAASIKEMLGSHPPSVFNVVIFSASGGSGSVIGPLMIRELNRRGLPTIAVVIGDDNSLLATMNTLKTMQSLDAIAIATRRPVVMSYHQNSPDVSRTDVDKDINSVMGSLSILLSGNNHGMDTQDMINFIQYNNVFEDSEPHLATMHVIMDEGDWNLIGHPISVASIYRNPNTEHKRIDTDYHTTGYFDLPNGIPEIHYTVSTEEVSKEISSLGGRIDDLHHMRAESAERERVAREAASKAAGGDVIVTDDDMVI